MDMDMDMGFFSAVVVYDRGLAKFLNFDEADLKKGCVEVEGRLVDVVFPKEGGGGNYHTPPICGGCCRVGRSLFLLGGFVPNPGLARDDIPSLMWSTDIDDASTSTSASACCTWSTVTSLSNPRTPERIYQPLAVPYGDRLFVLGGMPGDSSRRGVTELWMDVYDTKTKPPNRVASLPLPEFLSVEDTPYSYFLWEKEEGKNPRIMLDFDGDGAGAGVDDEPPPHRLVSYDVDEDSWELIGPVLPAFHGYTRCFVLFDSNTLLIIDNPFYWPVYDMRSNTITHQLELQYMKHLRRVVIGVNFCSYQRCPVTGSLFILLFMHPRDLETAAHVDVPCAKVKLYRDKKTGELAHTLVYLSNLRTGEYYQMYLFDREASIALDSRGKKNLRFDGEASTRVEPPVEAGDSRGKKKKLKRRQGRGSVGKENVLRGRV